MAAVPQDEAKEKAEHCGKNEPGPIVWDVPGIALPEPAQPDSSTLSMLMIMLGSFRGL